jgi:hypothetical protein
MTKNEPRIRRYPVFDPNVFADNPCLLAPFFRNTPAYLVKKHQAARERLPKFETTVQWSMVQGSGYWGATHPGAGKSFSGIMNGSSYPVYDSDCIYINPSRKVFAISDSPGMTTFSRQLFTDLDKDLGQRFHGDMGALINRLNQNIRRPHRATLTLLNVKHRKTGEPHPTAQAFIAGDTHLFCGNFCRKKMTPIKGQDAFLGRLSTDLEPIEIQLEKGDFFIIASDGITAIRSKASPTRLEHILFSHLDGNMENFAKNVIEGCNRIQEEDTHRGKRVWFAGQDDISIILVVPEAFQERDGTKSCLLGGYIQG